MGRGLSNNGELLATTHTHVFGACAGEKGGETVAATITGRERPQIIGGER